MLLQLLGLPASVGGIVRNAFGQGPRPAIMNRAVAPVRPLAPAGSRLLAALLLAGALAASGGAIRAQDEGAVRFTEGDYAAYTTLRLAGALVEQKQMFAHGNKAKKDAIDAEFAAACAGAGWTKERFGQVDEAVGMALSALDDPENASDEVDKATLATVKAHRKELSDYNGLQQRARELMQEQELAARRGAPPTAAQIAGKWVFDFDGTVNEMTEGMGEDLKTSARDGLAKSMTAATYSFGPGDRLVATVQRPDLPPESQEGTYRLDGSTLTVKARMGTRDRESQLSVGMKDGTLRIGMMGFYSIFRRE